MTRRIVIVLSIHIIRLLHFKRNYSSNNLADAIFPGSIREAMLNSYAYTICYFAVKDAKKETVPGDASATISSLKVDVLAETSNGTQSSGSDNKLVDDEDELQV
ncbi:hypothetical protein J1N35_024116 [Gossypium stocksii]|uniref:Uncharacterized protein n=1 Tax=Gossypium stocksii TaxID=47602 RepID=A0A9D4A4L0_9ROSI|nr:hypothetical protein J1N35_024116 [Gossypium stocksii]